MLEAKNIYYFSYINKIGGIETFFYYLSKKYKDKDLTIIYRDGDSAQIKRLSENIRCVKYTNNMNIKCERAFFNFNTDIINNVDAKEYILVLHGDYKAMIEQGQLDKKYLPLHKKINKYVGISQLVCDSWKELTGIEAELCYNPMVIDKPKRVLNLISATRLTKEKGKNRMIKLMEKLDAADIPYIWTIFTDDTNVIKNPNVIYMKPRLDIINFINNADYLVQLSDNEGYCYSIVEALTCGTPVICTKCPVFKEIGLKDRENCFLLDFDMNNIPIEDIYNTYLDFTYEPKKDSWDKLLIPGKTTYNPNKKVKIRIIKEYYDTELQEDKKPQDIIETNIVRAELIVSMGYARYI